MGDNKLKSYVERIERLEEERKAIGGDVRDIYTEAKGHNYNPKALRKIIAMRRQKADPVVDAEVEAYKAALGMAVEMVSNGEVSLRKAAKATGVSKSSIHRALAVPAASHDPETGEINGEEDPAREPDGVREESPVCRQPDAEDAGGPADADGGLGDGEDIDRAVDEGSDGQAETELSPKAPAASGTVIARAPATVHAPGGSAAVDDQGGDDMPAPPTPEVARAAPPADADDLAIPDFLRRPQVRA